LRTFLPSQLFVLALLSRKTVVLLVVCRGSLLRCELVVVGLVMM